MAITVTDDSYSTPFATDLVVGQDQDFNQSGSAASVNVQGFAGSFVTDPPQGFIEQGTAGFVGASGFSGTAELGFIVGGAVSDRAEVTPEGFAGSFSTTLAQADWQTRIAQAGVVASYDFATDLHGKYKNGDNGERGFYDPVERVETGGSLRFELRAGETSANIAGSWTDNSAPWVFNNNKFSEGDTFYIQFRLKVSATMLSNLGSWDSNWKTVIFHQDTSTFANIELTTVHPTSQGIMYSEGGAKHMFTELTAPDWTETVPLLLLQDWDIDAGPPWTREPNGVQSQYPTVGWNFPADRWVTCYYKVSIGTLQNSDSIYDSTVELWVQEEQEDFWKKIVAWRGPLRYDTNSTDGYNNLTLTPYMTALTTTASDDANMWFTELIVSSQPIPRPPVVTLPSWRQGMAVNEWKQVSSSVMNDLSFTPVSGNEGVEAKVTSWNGSCVDERTSEIWMLAPGGHDADHGNAVMSMKLEADSPVWELRRDNTPQANITTEQRYNADGRPVSSHTYNSEAFVPERNRAMRFGTCSSAGSLGQEFTNVDGFNPDIDDWDITSGGTIYPDLLGGVGNQITWPAVRDPQNGDVYIFRNSGGLGNMITRWNQSSNTMDQRVVWGFGDNMRDACAAFDTRRRRIFCARDAVSGYYDVDGNSWNSFTPSGRRPTSADGLVYVPSEDAYFYRAKSDDGVVYRMEAGTFATSTLTTTGGSGIDHTNLVGETNGAYRKFNYCPRLGGCYYISSFTQATWFIKLHDVDGE